MACNSLGQRSCPRDLSSMISTGGQWSMPIIVGAPRSGTTLLRFMLDSHPLISIPPETGFLGAAANLPQNADTRPAVFELLTNYPPDAPAWQDFGIPAAELWTALQNLANPSDVAGQVRTFYRLYASMQGKPAYGDKTPLHCQYLSAIDRLLPEAHFIHIVRDGRDVALSLRQMWFAPCKDIPGLATYWKTLLEETRQAGRKCAAYLELRYEDLLSNPEHALGTVCQFLHIDFSAQMLDYWRRAPNRLKEHKARFNRDGKLVVSREQRIQQQALTMQPPCLDRAFRWMREMTAAEQLEFFRYAGDTLEEFGYSPVARAATR
jgi:hypothetical protein